MAYEKDKSKKQKIHTDNALHPCFDVRKFEIMENICELLESIFFYGNFVAETPNEKQLEKLLKKIGYWSDIEDELISKINCREK